MENDLRKQIYNYHNVLETEDLLETWQKHDTDEWREETFEIIEQILLERLGQLPPRPVEEEVNQILNANSQAGNLAQALNDCYLATQVTPDQAEVYISRGLIHEEMGQAAEALADYREAIRLDPESMEAAEYIVNLEKEFKEEFENSPSKIHLDQALEFALDDESQKALEECELARQGLPDLSFAYNYLGLVLEQLGWLQPAIDAYLKAIQLNPRLYAARENLGNARLKLEEEQYRRATLQDWGEIEEEDRPEVDTSGVGESDEAQEMPEAGDPIPGWMYLDEKALLLAGWPGHRHIPGRTGYDPLDTDFELGHMEGVMIRAIMTGKFRTHNPFFLLIMVFLGIWMGWPPLMWLLVWLLSLLESSANGTTNARQLFSTFGVLMYFSPYWIVGSALLINAVSSLISSKPDTAKENGWDFF